MIIVDTAARERLATGRPVSVGMFGCGYMGRATLVHCARHLPVLKFVAICNRNVQRAIDAYLAAGVDRNDIVVCTTQGQVDDAIASGKRAVTDNPELVARAHGIEIALEATGALEYGTRICMMLFAAGKDVVSLNVELDATIGPILKKKADEAGVIFTGADGDQPGVTVNLARYVKMQGLVPLVAGNIKGLHDRTRNPTTQQEYAKRWNQTPSMVASFADGSKMSAEQAQTANALGFKVQKRGMVGRDHHGHIDELLPFYDIDEVRELGGVVDYVVGTKPSPGIYVFAATEPGDDHSVFFLELLKLGKGPLYSFYMAWHNTCMEFGISLLRVALCRDPIVQPLDGPFVDVVANAKVDLNPGDLLDGMGGYKHYGVCENYDTGRRENLLPQGLAEGAVVKRFVPRDQTITYDDVELPKTAMLVQLRAEQDARWQVA